MRQNFSPEALAEAKRIHNMSPKREYGSGDGIVTGSHTLVNGQISNGYSPYSTVQLNYSQGAAAYSPRSVGAYGASVTRSSGMLPLASSRSNSIRFLKAPSCVCEYNTEPTPPGVGHHVLHVACATFSSN